MEALATETQELITDHRVQPWGGGGVECWVKLIGGTLDVESLLCLIKELII